MNKSSPPPLCLYIAEYFVNHQVKKHPIYAEDLNQAVKLMNEFYRKAGKGHTHKSLERSTTGIEIGGTYYQPELSPDTDFQ